MTIIKRGQCALQARCHFHSCSAAFRLHMFPSVRPRNAVSPAEKDLDERRPEATLPTGSG